MSDPTPVSIASVEPGAVPIPVVVQAGIDAHGADTPAQTDARQTAAKARVDAAVETFGSQRRINLIWERTQAVMAIAVVLTTLTVSTVVIVIPLLHGERSTDVGLLFGLANLVIGFYFGRTNHARTGGIGGEQVNSDR